MGLPDWATMKSLKRLGVTVTAAVAVLGVGSTTVAAAPHTTTTTPPSVPPTDQTAAATPTESTLPEPATWSPGFAARIVVPQLLPAPAEDGSTEPTVVLGSIQIPKIGVDVTIYEGIRLATLNGGPGHWPGSPLPGHPGNSVFTGHRVSHNADFRDLDQLVPGDLVTFTGEDGRVTTYAVTGTVIVPPEGTWVLNQTANRTATLIACHPPGSVRERIVVHVRAVGHANPGAPIRGIAR